MSLALVDLALSSSTAMVRLAVTADRSLDRGAPRLDGLRYIGRPLER